jgi:hypothetical protein
VLGVILKAVLKSSCPALCRASTFLSAPATSNVENNKDVDGRDICAKTRFALLPGHDDRR